MCLLNLVLLSLVLIVVKDELCQTLSKEHCSDVNICLSSMKRIMHLEKPNSLWIIPVNISIGNLFTYKLYIVHFLQ